MSDRIRARGISSTMIGGVDINRETTKVVAHGVDPYIHPTTKQDPMAALTKTVMSGMGDMTQLQNLSRAGNKKDAARDFAAGNSPSKSQNLVNMGGGYDATYYGLQGEAQSISVAKSYKDALAQNNYFEKSQDPQGEADALYAELYGESFGEETNTMVLDGATERLVVARNEAQASFTNHHNLRAKEATMQNASIIIQDGLTSILENPNIEIDDGVPWMSNLIESVQTESLQGNSLVSPEEMTTSTLQHLGIELTKLAGSNDPDDQAKAMLLADSLKEVQIGDSQWYTEKAHDNGFKYKDAIDGIESQVLGAIKVTRAADKAQNKVARDEYAKGLYSNVGKLLTTNDPVERMQGANTLLSSLNENKDSLDFTKFKTLQDSLTKIIENKGFSTQTDPNTFRDARMQIARGALTEEALLDMSSTMTNSDFGSLMGLIQKAKDIKGSAPTLSLQFEDIIAGNKRILGANGTEVDALEAQRGEHRIYSYEQEMNESLLEYWEDNNGYPPRSLMKEWSVKAFTEADSGEYKRVINLEKDLTNSDARPRRAGNQRPKTSTPNETNEGIVQDDKVSQLKDYLSKNQGG